MKSDEMSRAVIRAENISKQYRLGTVGTGALAHDINRWWHQVRGMEDPYIRIGEGDDRSHHGNGEYVWALKDINFEVKHGEVLGIIGRNGAGKSTLLKLLSRTTAPTTGSIRIKGRVASLLEVGTGFHPELTGRENVFLNGAIMGMTKAEIRRKFDEIVEFSGVSRYIETPVKRYSSGMYVRLAFAVAAHLEPEILIVDEVLAVGDAEFQAKCLGKMKQVSVSEGRTVLFVSHNMGAVQKLCDTGLLLVDGRIAEWGEASRVIAAYLNKLKVASPVFERSEPPVPPKPLWFTRIYVTDEQGSEKENFAHDEDIFVNYELAYGVDKFRHDYNLFCIVLDHAKNRVFAAESAVLRSASVRLKIERSWLVRGRYSIHTFIHKPRVEQIDVAEDVCGFSIVDNGSAFNVHGDYDYGRVFGRTEWSYGPS